MLAVPSAARVGATSDLADAWGCDGPDFAQCSVPAEAASDVIAVAAGKSHSLAVKSDGSLVAWGCAGGPDFGQCDVPVEATDVTAVDAGAYHSLALTSDGSVVAWGCGGPSEAGQCTVPPGASTGIAAIAAGDFHSLALGDDEAVVAWGCEADSGQCDVPVEALADVTAVAAGAYHSLALKSDGSVVAWGCDGNDFGQCDVPAAASSDVVAIAAAAYHSLALKSDGSVLAWGCVGPNYGQCDVPAALSDVSAIAAGESHSAALESDGSVVLWGCGGGRDFGQCTVPATSATGVTAITAGDYHSLAIHPPPSDPGGTGTATPSSVVAGGSTLLTIAVSPGENPASTGLAAAADLTAIGGGAAQAFFDDATHGDATAGDGTFSYQATVAAATTTGAKSLPAEITDAQARTGNTTIGLTVTGPSTSPSGEGAATPDSVAAGGSTLLTVAVTPDTAPASTGLSVTVDLSAIGGAAAQSFSDSGSDGDGTANDNTFSYQATVAPGTTPGAVSLPATIADAQSRTGSATIDLTVSPSTPTAVSLLSLAATRSPRGVLVRWRTASAARLLGFTLYRERQGRLTRVTARVVPAHRSRAYWFVDRAAPAGPVRYRLQGVSVDGTRSWFGATRVR